MILKVSQLVGKAIGAYVGARSHLVVVFSPAFVNTPNVRQLGEPLPCGLTYWILDHTARQLAAYGISNAAAARLHHHRLCAEVDTVE